MIKEYKEFYTEEEWQIQNFPPNVTIEYSVLHTVEQFMIRYLGKHFTHYQGEGHYLDPVTNLRK